MNKSCLISSRTFSAPCASLRAQTTLAHRLCLCGGCKWKASSTISAGGNSPPVKDGRVKDWRLNHTLLSAGANPSVQPLFKRFAGPKWSLLHAQLIKIAKVRSGCPKNIVVRHLRRGVLVMRVALGIAGSALMIVNTHLKSGGPAKILAG